MNHFRYLHLRLVSCLRFFCHDSVLLHFLFFIHYPYFNYSLSISNSLFTLQIYRIFLNTMSCMPSLFLIWQYFKILKYFHVCTHCWRKYTFFENISISVLPRFNNILHLSQDIFFSSFSYFIFLLFPSSILYSLCRFIDFFLKCSVMYVISLTIWQHFKFLKIFHVCTVVVILIGNISVSLFPIFNTALGKGGKRIKRRLTVCSLSSNYLITERREEDEIASMGGYCSYSEKVTWQASEATKPPQQILNSVFLKRYVIISF